MAKVIKVTVPLNFNYTTEVNVLHSKLNAWKLQFFMFSIRSCHWSICGQKKKKERKKTFTLRI